MIVTPIKSWLCELVLCLVLGNIAGLLNDLQQPPGHGFYQEPQGARSKICLYYRPHEISFHLLNIGPIKLICSAVLPALEWAIYWRLRCDNWGGCNLHKYTSHILWPFFNWNNIIEWLHYCKSVVSFCTIQSQGSLHWLLWCTYSIVSYDIVSKKNSNKC